MARLGKGLVLLLLMAWPLLALVLAGEDARSTGCLAAKGAAACAACHAAAGEALWATRQDRPCSPYCMTCHGKAEMARHHNVGTPLKRPPGAALPLAKGQRVACFTCHLLSQPRYDSVRWKAASLYDRTFRTASQYKTYFLVTRNDQGQLCLACH